jgi:hypothetical protein
MAARSRGVAASRYQHSPNASSFGENRSCTRAASSRCSSRVKASPSSGSPVVLVVEVLDEDGPQPDHLLLGVATRRLTVRGSDRGQAHHGSGRRGHGGVERLVLGLLQRVGVGEGPAALAQRRPHDVVLDRVVVVQGLHRCGEPGLQGRDRGSSCGSSPPKRGRRGTGATVRRSWEPSMDVQILGPLRVLRDGVELDLGRPKQRLLLAVLACSRVRR